jgi:hypothetical protein
MSATAARTPRGTGPPGGAASVNSGPHRKAERAQGTSMFASELNVCSAAVWFPFGAASRTLLRPPVRTSARLAAIAAAFCGPGSCPAMFRPVMNWASAKPAATVVRSLTTTVPGTGGVPSTDASRTAAPRPATRYNTAPESRCSG